MAPVFTYAGRRTRFKSPVHKLRDSEAGTGVKENLKEGVEGSILVTGFPSAMTHILSPVTVVCVYLDAVVTKASHSLEQ